MEPTDPVMPKMVVEAWNTRPASDMGGMSMSKTSDAQPGRKE